VSMVPRLVRSAVLWCRLRYRATRCDRAGDAKGPGRMAVMCLGERHGERFAAYHGDCVAIFAQLPEASTDFSVYSPPFSNLFCYSDSVCDMGNAATDAEFVEHYGFLLRELRRVTVPGRLTAVHCSDLPRQKWRDGVIGFKDLSGAIIAAHEAAG